MAKFDYEGQNRKERLVAERQYALPRSIKLIKGPKSMREMMADRKARKEARAKKLADKKDNDG